MGHVTHKVAFVKACVYWYFTSKANATGAYAFNIKGRHCFGRSAIFKNHVKTNKMRI